ncbi:Purple acid phosphatase 3 [Camellia lanceoleosa]|uniref:Purple acid phosphatase 3 n=1 Tax=Camellia lanceoleosa TaxID=1840588 RepID=A0ACC0FDL1_9ERIC|nr:Purple acid phosphatase 3 [Camellia lanceoleosa]
MAAPRGELEGINLISSTYSDDDDESEALVGIHMAMPVLVSLDNKQSQSMRMRVNALLLLGVLGLVLCLLVSICSAELQRFEHPPSKGDGSMGVVGEKLGIDFVVSTGDNFYDNGLTGGNDAAFEDSFAKVDTANSFQKQWYSGKYHPILPSGKGTRATVLRKIDKQWLCVRNYFLKLEVVNFYFIDTNPFVNKYFQNPNNHTYDWSGVLPRDRYISNLLKGLRMKMKQSSGKWKIVVGHHTIRSIGHHGDTVELVHQLLPILEGYKVDMYMNGHDHCLEHIGYAKRIHVCPTF